MALTNVKPTVVVPKDYPTSLIFMDESGSKSGAGNFFVMSAVKSRDPGKLMRSVKSVRDRNNFTSEFKFGDITKGALPAYFDLVDAVAESDAHIAACVVDRAQSDPFTKGQAEWEHHAKIATGLLIGCINRRELVSVVMDGISTPTGIALDDKIRTRVNRKFNSISVVAALCADSRTSDGLQIADLVASAIAFERRQQSGVSGRRVPSTTSPKAKVASRLMAAFSVSSFDDYRDGRVNIATWGRSPAPRILGSIGQLSTISG